MIHLINLVCAVVLALWAFDMPEKSARTAVFVMSICGGLGSIGSIIRDHLNERREKRR